MMNSIVFVKKHVIKRQLVITKNHLQNGSMERMNKIVQ
jgi:hypothetical protein